MLSSPNIGDRVQVWYGPKSRDVMPHHARCGVIAVVGTGRPRNHGVRFCGAESVVVSVPAGNLRTPPLIQPCRVCGSGRWGPAWLCMGCGYIVCDGCDQSHGPGGDHVLGQETDHE